MSDTERQRLADMAKQLGEDLAADLDEFMRLRFEPVLDRYLDVLRGCLQAAVAAKETPPIWTARVDYESFTENVAELKHKVASEVIAHMAEWLAMANEMGVRAVTDELLAQRIDDYITRLYLSGGELMLRYGDALIDADKAWRLSNPELALGFPNND
ncbi:hypothetical protein [Hyphomicrobium sp. CS1BSMeth3]|uniref:hypothetical protein n=1 Tax=Hyphomicrobium sp. CS1BSMeth3 TaxID=1892844 RepID=UPI0015773CF9|nr:hypothetical protein [Hyphomicrobium sp. CS1BSMeth3]